MKSLIVILGALVATQVAKADGFVCQTLNGDLQIKVYNHTQAEVGVRSAAVMVLSDPRISQGRKTIAVFRDATETLSSKGATYEADVDLRYSEISRKGEYLLGTRLGELDTLELVVGFSYANPVEDGELLKGVLLANKRDGSRSSFRVECERYLKQ